MATLKLEASLAGHDGAVWCCAWSKSGLLATCGADRTVRVWTSDETGWRCLAVSSEFRRTVRRVAWGTDGRSIAAACFDGISTILELMGGAEPRLEAAVTLEGHENEVKGVAYSGSGGLLATCSRDRSVWIWEVGTDFEYECIAVLSGHNGDVKSVTWHPAVELLVSCGYDSVAKVWAEDEDDWFCTETLSGHGDTVWDAVFDGAGERLATVGADRAAILWKREAPTENATAFVVDVRVENVHEGAVYSVDFSDNGKLLATSGADDAVAVLSRREVENENDIVKVIAKKERAHRGDVNCVAWKHESNEVLASCGDDGVVRIWKLVGKSND